ncbi:MAG: MAPEG family protein [Gammaproteobacteria bacterium]|nr:MAPEG family protein [Gammaproteobacteria bacterium]
MFAPVTSLYAALVALLVVGLAVRITYLRHRLHRYLGVGNDSTLERAVRAHGNALENVPLTLVLMLLLELRGGTAWLLHLCGLVMVIARVMHVSGINQAFIGPRMHRSGAHLNWLVVVVLAIALLNSLV